MKVPRVENKLRVFCFKMQFSSQVSRQASNTFGYKTMMFSTFHIVLKFSRPGALCYLYVGFRTQKGLEYRKFCIRRGKSFMFFF